MAFLEILTNPKGFFKDSTKLSPLSALFLLAFVFIAGYTVFFLNFSNHTSTIELYEGYSITIGVGLIPLIALVFFFILSFIFHIVLKVYGSNKNYGDSLKTLIISLIPSYFLVILLLSYKGAVSLVSRLPFLILFFAIYQIYLSVNAVKIQLNLKNSNAIAALIVFLFYSYIISLRIWSSILFYLIILAFLYFNRKKFESSGATLLLRTKYGLKLMDKISEKFPKTVRGLGYTGIFVGYIAMLFMMYLLIDNLFDLFFVPDTLSAVSPVLPGVPIPGSPIMLPLVTGIVSLFFVMVIHEFSHGVVARAHGLKVKASGIFFMGPIGGAFVEPDDKQIDKKPLMTQLSIFAAGPFSNILTAIILILAINFLITPAILSIVEEQGVLLTGIEPNSSAESIGLIPGLVINQIEGEEILSSRELSEKLTEYSPGDTISIMANGSDYPLVLGTRPGNESAPYMGVFVSDNLEIKPKYQNTMGKAFGFLLFNLFDFFYWFFVVSLGIGIVNLLPLGPVDGGRILLASLTKFMKKKKAMDWWKKVSMAVFILIIVILFFPMFKWILTQLAF